MCANPGPRILAVNGDEGEPGTLKDRHYLERAPHLFLVGMPIAAWAVEAERCYVYVRDEYPAVLEILAREVAALEAAGIVAPGYVEVRRNAGAYICGEESAMVGSIEGTRGLPRHRPPHVAQVGLFGRPTLVPDVETPHWIARVVREGPGVLSAHERNGRTGLRSYSVSGRVREPGVRLLPAGFTIADVIEAAGGMSEGHVSRPTSRAGRPRGCCRRRWTTSRSTSTRSSRTARPSDRRPSSCCPTMTARASPPSTCCASSSGRAAGTARLAAPAAAWRPT